MSCGRLFEPVDAAHLETCAECRAVHQTLGSPAPANDLLKLKAAALAELELSPRARPWWAGSMGVLAVSAVAVGVAMQLLPPNTPQHASMFLRQLSAAGWAATMLAGCLFAVMPGGRKGRVLVLSGLGLCFGFTLAAISGVGPAGVGSLGCALLEWGIALPPLLLALLVLTSFAFDASRALTAAVATMSAGVLAIHLHCPNGTLTHQVVAHLVPVLVLMAVVLWLRRLLPSRSQVP